MNDNHKTVEAGLKIAQGYLDEAARGLEDLKALMEELRELLTGEQENRKMSDIIQARERLKKVTERLDVCRKVLAGYSAEIDEIIALMVRKSPVSRAKKKSLPITPKVRKYILSLRKEMPNAHLQQIATLAGVNIGRVSEVIRQNKSHGR